MKQRDVDDFIVESTPVLDIKKTNIAAATVDSTPSHWDSDRTEVYADIDESDVIATLTSEDGGSHPITTFPFVIGRGNECDLVLQGKGISRKHAEIVFQSGRFVVNDLESLNGLKVNGYKVARVILEENDQVKLGEVCLHFSSGSREADSQEAKNPQKASGLFRNSVSESASDDTFGPGLAKKLAIFSLLAVSAVVFAGVGYLYFTGGNQDGVVLLSEASSVAPPDVATYTQTGGRPTSTIAPSMEVSTPLGAGPTPVPEEPPSAHLSSIAPPPSLSMAAPKSGSTENEASEEATATPVVKPKIKVVDRNADAERAVLEAKRLYIQGDGQAAIAKVKPYVGATSVSGRTETNVKAAYSDYTSLYDQYTQGQSAFKKGDKEMAFSLWTDFMSREEKMLGEKSAYSRSIASKVVDEFVARGNDASNRGDYHNAYKNWEKALSIGDSVAARIAVDNLNNRAKQLYRQALRLEYVNASKARAMWQEVTQLLPPGTEYHTKASAKLAWYEKWGA